MKRFNTLCSLVYVDDDEDDRLFFQEIIQELFPNIDLRLYQNGMDLINGLIEDVSNLPRLIMMDLNMPGKDGFMCLEEIRDHYALRRIPIAIYSTSSSPSDKNRSLGLGANHFLTKPTSFSEMKNLLGETIGRYVD